VLGVDPGDWFELCVLGFLLFFSAGRPVGPSVPARDPGLFGIFLFFLDQ